MAEVIVRAAVRITKVGVLRGETVNLGDSYTISLNHGLWETTWRRTSTGRWRRRSSAAPQAWPPG